MSIFDTLIGKITPYKCLGCEAEGHLLCVACADQLVAVPERCYRCRQTSQNALTCPTCQAASRLHRVQVATVYDGNAKALIWQLKLAGVRTAARIMAKSMASLMKFDADELIIVPVPTATSRVRQRGYDQAKLLARELARQTRLPYLDCLMRSGQAHQHGLSRQARLIQLESAFRVKRPRTVQNSRILLVDDVITTGSTLEAAATVLQTAGAKQTNAIVFAQPPLTTIK